MMDPELDFLSGRASPLLTACLRLWRRCEMSRLWMRPDNLHPLQCFATTLGGRLHNTSSTSGRASDFRMPHPPLSG